MPARKTKSVRARSDDQSKRLVKFHEFKTLTGHTVTVRPWKRKHFLEMVERVQSLFAGIQPDEGATPMTQMLQKHGELERIGRHTLEMTEEEFDEVFEYEEDFLELVAGLWQVCIQPLGKNLAGLMASGGGPAVANSSPSQNSTTTS